MATGDVVFFDQFMVDVQEAVHNLETDSIKGGIVTNATVPAATTADPRWGAGGTTNFSTNQVTPGGNYANGGPAVANPTVTLSAGAAVFDGDDIAIASNVSNPSGAYWMIIYNDTAAGKNAIGYVELGGPVDLSAGDFSVTWNAAGISSMDQA